MRLWWRLAASCLAFDGSMMLGADSLSSLGASDPFYVDHTYPKLTTPQWVGESDVDAVVVLAIDDMRSPEKYEAYLRPILERLKEKDGKGHVSIMSNALDPSLAKYKDWISEGVSLEVHTLTHPCPLLSQNDFEKAENTYFGGIDLLNHVPGNRPVAYRMPCCDSINSPSPRFYAELFNRSNPAGQFLQIDSSIMCAFTSRDPDLPREWVLNGEGEERFDRYLPFESFVTTIENYPYPYVVGGLCWEFPCMVPSDWEAQNIQGVNHADTVRDWKIALDLTVLKQGVFNLVFHPHGWIKSSQVVELIDYAREKYGRRVLFLNFQEALGRLNKNLLSGNPLRDVSGVDNGVRMVDLNTDGFLDVLIGNESTQVTRIWNPETAGWNEQPLPVRMVDEQGRDTGVKVLRLTEKPEVSLLIRNDAEAGAWTLTERENRWQERSDVIGEFRREGQTIVTRREGRDVGVRIRDFDRDGQSELLTGTENGRVVLEWSDAEKTWGALGFGLPDSVQVVDGEGRDNGVRFADVNEDGYLDLLQSNPEHYSLHLYIPEVVLGFAQGWSREVVDRTRKSSREGIPLIVRSGDRRHNGAWFHSGHLWVQNEETADLPDLVDRRSFASLLTGELPEPLGPEEAIGSMVFDEELSVELVAAEPLMADPVNFEWSADGRLWVVEMGDYPAGLNGEGQAGGRVRVLEDEDGDGRYDRSVTFLEGLNFPTGVMPWGRGVLISAAPEIFYAEDRDGDGVADFREVWFSGFVEGNQQHRVNGFSYGLDNWIYGANGDSGGQIRTSGRAGTVSINGRDFRFDPVMRRFQAIEGRTQFGRERDDWGNWFGNNNPNWLWHYWYPERYLSDDSLVALPDNKRYLGMNDPYVYRVGESLQRFNDVGHRNHVTSGNSPTPYRDDLFDGEYRQSVFISEPVHNVIHREVLSRSGVSFQSRRASGEERREFLASSDPWFRPTGMKVGPDGALYFADMYRLVIEHPEWIPDDVASALNLRSGEDRGRIYRVTPKEKERRRIPDLASLSSVELVGYLKHSNGWVRDTAQRRLVALRDPGAFEELRGLVHQGESETAVLHALWTLDGLGELSLPEVVGVLGSTSGELRRNAVRLSERFLDEVLEGDDDSPNFRLRKAFKASISDCARDVWASVRLQTALSLGTAKGKEWGELVAVMALNESSNDVWYGIEASLAKHAEVVEGMVTHRLTSADFQQKERLYRQLIRLALLERRSPSVRRLVEALLGHEKGEPWEIADVLSDYFLQLERSKLAGKADYDFRVEKGTAWSLSSRNDGRRFLAEAESLLQDDSLGGDVRESIYRFLILLGRSDDALNRLLEADESGVVQLLVLKSIASTHSGEILDELRGAWAHLSPSVRDWAVGRLVRNERTLSRLIRESRDGSWPGLLEMREVQTMARKSSLPELQAVVLGAGRSASGQDSVEQLLTSIFESEANAESGHQVYVENCSVCHRVGETGNEVGPDLRSVSDRSTRGLLTAIVEPNRAVEAKFVGYTVETRAGDVLTGVIESESVNSLTLRTPTGERHTLLRREVIAMQGSGLSLMPEGLGAQVGNQGMADLIAFLQGL